jgi:hypothetical protein
MSSIDQAKSSFFKAEHFAVVGASKDTAKIGNKVSVCVCARTRTTIGWCEADLSSVQVLRWYKARDFDAIPVHPKEASIEEISTIASVFDIHEPSTTSLSIITPPKVSLPVCKTALLELGVNAIWLQVSRACRI